jgi:hypothetical protein
MFFHSGMVTAGSGQMRQLKYVRKMDLYCQLIDERHTVFPREVLEYVKGVYIVEERK